MCPRQESVPALQSSTVRYSPLAVDPPSPQLPSQFRDCTSQQIEELQIRSAAVLASVAITDLTAHIEFVLMNSARLIRVAERAQLLLVECLFGRLLLLGADEFVERCEASG